jgi:hypothetical protein
MWHAANAVISGLVVSAALVSALVHGGDHAAAALGLMVGIHGADAATVARSCSLHAAGLFAATFMGMLNARGYFFIPSLGAALLNVVMIGSVLWLAPGLGETLETQIFGLAIGVLLAGLAQAAFQLPNFASGGISIPVGCAMERSNGP